MKIRSFFFILTALALPGFLPAPAPAQSDIGRAMEREYGVVSRDTAEGRRLNDQLDRVVDRIVAAVNRNRSGREFALRSARILGGRSSERDREVNAFALPDGRIYVTLGLMRQLAGSLRADDELAFVVGHEVTHVVERHSAHQMKKSLPVNILAIIVGAASRSDTVGQLAGLGAAAYSSRFSRQDEYRADRGGLLAMAQAGFDPHAAVAMLERLQALGGERNRFLNGIWGSHPITENRIKRVRQLIADLEAGRELPEK